MRSPTSLMLCLSIALATLPCAVGTAQAGPSESAPEYAERNGIYLQAKALLLRAAKLGRLMQQHEAFHAAQAVTPNDLQPTWCAHNAPQRT